MADKAKSKLLDACRAALRIPAFCNDFDEEIADVIDAARAELVAGGVLPEKANDAPGLRQGELRHGQPGRRSLHEVVRMHAHLHERRFGLQDGAVR